MVGGRTADIDFFRNKTDTFHDVVMDNYSYEVVKPISGTCCAKLLMLSVFR